MITRGFTLEIALAHLYGDADLMTVLRDLLIDARYLASARGVSFDDANRAADRHYRDGPPGYADVAGEIFPAP